MSKYQDLDVWKFAVEMVKEVYQLMKCYPKDERFSLVSQTKRAAISVPANIAEGLGRRHKNDTLRFLFIARGSIYELETLLNVALIVEIINNEQFDKIMSSVKRSLRVLGGLINYLESSQLT